MIDWTTSTTPRRWVTKPPFPQRYRGPRRLSPGGSYRAMRRAVERMADALRPGITSPPRPWFKLSIPGEERPGPEVRQFLHTVERAMMVEIPNPYPILQQFV